MPEITEVTIPIGDIAMGAVAAHPDGIPSGGVLVLMEAFGVNEHIRDVCHRLAEAGYVALAPDLYHRAGRFITAEYSDPTGVMEHFARLDATTLAAAIGAAQEWLTNVAGVDAFGVVGFCLGGYCAVLAAIRFDPAVVAGFYGAGLSIRREGSPLPPLSGEFDAISCPVLLFYGADDPVIPPEEAVTTQKALVDAHVDHSANVYDDAGHGFFCDARDAYRPGPAADAWARVLSAFSKALVEPAP